MLPLQTATRKRVPRPECLVRTRQRHFCLLGQGLAESFQGVAAELRQLIEKMDAVVGEADCAGPGDAAAADEAGVGDGVMRSAKGTAGEKRLTDGAG